jgi:hypothetical protein
MNDNLKKATERWIRRVLVALDVLESTIFYLYVTLVVYILICDLERGSSRLPEHVHSATGFVSLYFAFA